MPHIVVDKSVDLDYFTDNNASGGDGGNHFHFIKKDDGAILTKISCIIMSSTLSTTNLALCNGHLIDRSSAGQGQSATYFIGLNSWPGINVEVKYNGRTKWHEDNQTLQSYTAGVGYNETTNYRMTIQSNDQHQALVLDMMLWCAHGWSGDQCKHRCHSTSNKMCNKDGKLACKHGYGKHSCTDINECSGQSSCKNGGTCKNTIGSFICQCRTGWTGPTCEVDIDECNLGYCTNASTCTNSPGSFHCRCNRGFHGRQCTDLNECKIPVKLCQHESTCLNHYGSFACRCGEGYSGARCDKDVDECSLSICSPHSTNCSNTFGSYRCNCSAGWTGKNCENDIDECKSNPCYHGTCINTDGSYKCRCYPGYDGTYCEHDADECLKITCPNNGTCVNLNPPQRFRCDCLKGWDPKSRCHHHIDECKLSNPCVHGACISNTGDYICTCDTGWTGRNCSVDLNECRHQPCLHNGTCINRLGSYKCHCSVGWVGKNCSIDINECDVIQPCGLYGKCNNVDGGYTCQCAAGWMGQNCYVDINECNTLQPCKNNGKCSNTEGGYACHCAVGWTGQNCSVDVNECSKFHPCQNNGSCSNTQGLYLCHCADGWKGQTCSTDINECNTLHPCSHNAKCKNTMGGYTCSCSVGWQGNNCTVDVNECDTFHPCQNKGSCVNTVGSYICQCPVEWKGQNCSVDVNECETFHPCHNKGSCINTEGNYTCQCPAEWKGQNCTVDVNECNISPCKHNATCYNFEDGYNCTCPPFWTGKNCEIEVEECNNFPCNKHSTTTSAQTSSIFVRLEDAIYPGCTSSGWNVTLDMPTLTQLYPEIKADQIYFGDNSCRGKLMGTQLIFLQGFKDCLTAERISGDTIIYENELFYAIYDSIHPFIIRQHKWTYGVECDISRNEATSSHVHHNVETHHSAISGHYSINMTFFKDPEYMNQLPGNPIQTSVGDDVYVKVFTTATDWNIKMRLHTCYTKPKETTTNMTYNIIRDGCEVDSNTHIISQSTHETRFVFQDFEYSTNREGLNIYCNATFCETKDFSPGCAQSCIPHETQALVGK
ncbi:neurogenic locus notch homolog protein 1-like [Mercenaria mercenaria]|uniref:neurogenic locus notch homolog protein 1-like n=1 Tax=Mercenaria mercenaria TaxID=6596 RepID=UPI00234E8DF4|nr:neurogenic locus notch homolog protein 1-like [Mercenaria mercenaria]